MLDAGVARRALASLLVAASVAAAAGLALAGGPGARGPVDLPLRTWVARPLPGRDRAPCPDGCKHMRLGYDPADGRIYVLGGDHSGTGGFLQSGRNELYSYSIAGNDWRLEQPYCRADGTPQPSGPDEVGFTYDTRRNVFWMLPGYMWRSSGERCPGAHPVDGRIMTYDPVKKTWRVPAVSPPPRSGVTASKFVQFDAATDSLIRFYWDGGWGPTVAIYDIGSDRWSFRSFPGKANLDGQYTAMDPERRQLYVISPREARLYRYDIARRSLAELGPAPPGACCETMPVWDTVSRVLLWPYYADGEAAVVTLYAYHPDGGGWERLPSALPDGRPVQGRHAVFDPVQNALLVMGPKTGSAPVFLFRYGAGADPAR